MGNGPPHTAGFDQPRKAFFEDENKKCKYACGLFWLAIKYNPFPPNDISPARYLLMFVAFVYFGARICVAAQTNKGLFYRILLMTSVCGLALSTKGAFFVVAAANAWRADTFFPNRSGRYDMILYDKLFVYLV